MSTHSSNIQFNTDRLFSNLYSGKKMTRKINNLIDYQQWKDRQLSDEGKTNFDKPSIAMESDTAGSFLLDTLDDDNDENRLFGMLIW